MSMFERSHGELRHGQPQAPHGTTHHVLEAAAGRILRRGESPAISIKLLERARERREAYGRRDFRTYIGNVCLGPDGPGPGQQVWRFQETNPEPGVDGDRAISAGDYLTISATTVTTVPTPTVPEVPKTVAIKRVVWEGKISFLNKIFINPQGELWNFPYPEGGAYGDWVDWFSNHYEAELRAPAQPVRLPTAEETVERAKKAQPLSPAA